MLGHFPELGGRTLVAEASGYRKGQPILVERPHIVFPATSQSQTYRKVRIICKLCVHDESIVDDLALAITAYIEQYQDVDIGDYFATMTAGSIVAESLGHMDHVTAGFDKLWKTIPKYFDVDVNRLSHFAMTMICNAHHTTEKILLYKLISKMAHSCDPNTLLLIHDSAEDVMNESSCSVIALKDISPGEPLTFSYLSGQPGPINGIFATRGLRQTHLLETKFFKCNCSRCSEEEVTGGSSKIDSEPPDLIRRVHRCYSAMNNYNMWIQEFPDYDHGALVPEACQWTTEQLILIRFGLAYKYLVALPNLYHWGVVVSEKRLGPGLSFLHQGLRLTSESNELTMCVILGVILPVCRAIGQTLMTLPKGFKFIGPRADDAAQSTSLLESIVKAEHSVIERVLPEYHGDVQKFKDALPIYLP